MRCLMRSRCVHTPARWGHTGCFVPGTSGKVSEKPCEGTQWGRVSTGGVGPGTCLQSMSFPSGFKTFQKLLKLGGAYI